MIDSNLKFLRGVHNISQAELAEQLGIPRTTLSAYERGFVQPNIELMLKMGKYFNVSLDDLIAFNLEHKKEDHKGKEGLRILAISVDAQNNSNIELVDKKAEAGYLDSMADPQFIKELPKIHFPNIPQGTYRGFEIRGDSMLPIVQGSIVISSYVEHLSDIKDGKTYVVISKSEGVVYKRVKRIKEEKSLLLISDNQNYMPYKLPFNEVAEVWQYYAHLGFNDAYNTYTSMIDQRMNDMHTKIGEIYEKIM
jgi:transcriptional regulator with XRE-family HTH domain